MYGPTGEGQTVNGVDVAGQPGVPLPPRPIRAAANDAAAVRGICNPPDNAGAGDIDMKGAEPWRQDEGV